MATKIVKIEMAQVNVNIRIAQIRLEPALSKYESELWKELGPAPKREFPDFNKIGPELERIKRTLRERADKESQGGLKTKNSTGLKLHLDLVNSGDNKGEKGREKGLLLAPF